MLRMPFLLTKELALPGKDSRPSGCGLLRKMNHEQMLLTVNLTGCPRNVFHGERGRIDIVVEQQRLRVEVFHWYSVYLKIDALRVSLVMPGNDLAPTIAWKPL
jgi:hypothetical protein